MGEVKAGFGEEMMLTLEGSSSKKLSRTRMMIGMKRNNGGGGGKGGRIIGSKRRATANAASKQRAFHPKYLILTSLLPTSTKIILTKTKTELK